MAKIVSLVVKIGAVVFILAIPQAYAIQLQLLGGIWIIQLLPPILLGLYTQCLQRQGVVDRLGRRHSPSAPTWRRPKDSPPRSIRSRHSA